MTEFSSYLDNKQFVTVFCRQPFFSIIEHTFQISPLFWVWLTSVLVWFFLEVAVWEAYAFNAKHSYIADLQKNTQFLLNLSSLLLQTKFKKNFLKILTRIYS